MPEKIYTMDSDFSELKKYGLIYLASPYTKYVFGLTEATKDVALIAGRLIRKGLNIYSPIVHTHYIAVAAGIDPVDHEFWMKVDAAFMERCDALMVCRMPGWDESSGVAHEVDEFDKRNRPIIQLNPGFIR